MALQLCGGVISHSWRDRECETGWQTCTERSPTLLQESTPDISSQKAIVTWVLFHVHSFFTVFVRLGDSSVNRQIDCEKYVCMARETQSRSSASDGIFILLVPSGVNSVGGVSDIQRNVDIVYD